jgi:hypothetical protein
MGEEMKVSLSNPLASVENGCARRNLLAAVLAAAHEILSRILWGSLTAWWIGQRAATLERKR